jgi:hypothetical protein
LPLSENFNRNKNFLTGRRPLFFLYKSQKLGFNVCTREKKKEGETHCPSFQNEVKEREGEFH